MNDAMRKELVEYYKWIVNLEAVILTISFTMVGITNTPVGKLIVVGWVAIMISAFFNMQIVKRLIILKGLTDKKHKTAMDNFYLRTMSNMSIYGTIQNAAFVIGVIMIVLGFLLR